VRLRREIETLRFDALDAHIKLNRRLATCAPTDDEIERMRPIVEAAKIWREAVFIRDDAKLLGSKSAAEAFLAEAVDAAANREAES
jgi:hypothetical protein